MEYQNLYQDGMPPPAPAPPPHRPSRRVSRVAASVAAGAVLLGGGAAIGIAATGGASAATAGSATPDPHRAGGLCAQRITAARVAGHPVRAARLGARCRLAWVAAHGIHGTVTYKAKNGTSTLAFERGVVTSASATAVTVRASDGTVWTWDFVASTVIRESGHRVARDKLVSGDQVLVAGPVVPAARDARLIRIKAAR
jgi:hypothetical protein